MFNEEKCNTDMNTILKIADHIKEISSLLGIEVTESNKKTPYRVAKMYVNEVFKNRGNRNYTDLLNKMVLFKNEGTNKPITIKNVPFSSMCEHHWLPFMGEISVTYIPNEKIIGLSKIPRIIKYYSQRPQLQERLTNDIGNFLVNLLTPKFLSVKVIATHTCVLCRGAESPAETETEFEYVKSDYTQR